MIYTPVSTVVVWQANDGWRWYQRAGNGETVAESGESYTRRWSAKRAARRANGFALAAGGAVLELRRGGTGRTDSS